MLPASAVSDSAGVASFVLAPLASDAVVTGLTSSATAAITGAAGAVVSTDKANGVEPPLGLPAASVAVAVRL